MFIVDIFSCFVQRISFECRGFFTCLGKDGTVYDDTKYIWLQARQVWMYLRLYKDVPRLREKNIFEPAVKGEF